MDTTRSLMNDWIEKLNDPDTDAYDAMDLCSAVGLVGQPADKIIPVLVNKVFYDESSLVRMNAGIGLKWLPEEYAGQWITLFETALKGEDTSVKLNVLKALEYNKYAYLAYATITDVAKNDAEAKVRDTAKRIQSKLSE